jgi:hypothetical protein
VTQGRSDENPAAIRERTQLMPQSILVRDGEQACAHALHLIARQWYLIAGDALFVGGADEDPHSGCVPPTATDLESPMAPRLTCLEDARIGPAMLSH